MTWVAEDTFEGATDEANLTAWSGGSGWSAAYVNRATNLEYSDTATASYGTTSARVVSNAGNTFYTRDLTTGEASSGVFYVSLRKSSTSAGVNAFTARSGTGSGTGRINAVLDASGNLVSGGEILITGYTANTWYDLRFTYDCVAGTYTTAYWNGSAWVSGTSRSMGATNVTLTKVGLGGDTGSNSWVDHITPTDTHPSTTNTTNFFYMT